jgi:heat shock protein HtpX
LGGSGGLILAFLLAVIMNAGRRIPLEGATPQTAHLFIVNPLSGQSLVSLFSSHPPVEKRVARLLSLAPAYNDSATTEFVLRG